MIQSVVTYSIKDYKMQMHHLSSMIIRNRKLLLTCHTRNMIDILDHSTNTINTGTNRFPFNNFTHYLTPFSRCFSSFLHSTCSLSVSCQYLALDGIYHPFWAAFPNNSTLRYNSIDRWTLDIQTGLSPSAILHSRRLAHQFINHDSYL
jgi:hypothetical protein